MQIKVLQFHRARIVPAVFTIAAILLSILVSSWWLLSIPFVAIGTMFSAPNLNMFNGLPSYLSMVVGFAIMTFHKPSGLAILAGAMTSFYLSALEIWIFAKPYHE